MADTPGRDNLLGGVSLEVQGGPRTPIDGLDVVREPTGDVIFQQRASDCSMRHGVKGLPQVEYTKCERSLVSF